MTATKHVGPRLPPRPIALYLANAPTLRRTRPRRRTRFPHALPIGLSTRPRPRQPLHPRRRRGRPSSSCGSPACRCPTPIPSPRSCKPVAAQKKRPRPIRPTIRAWPSTTPAKIDGVRHAGTLRDLLSEVAERVVDYLAAGEQSPPSALTPIAISSISAYRCGRPSRTPTCSLARIEGAGPRPMAPKAVQAGPAG